jgi:hypothetical protein
VLPYSQAPLAPCKEVKGSCSLVPQVEMDPLGTLGNDERGWKYTEPCSVPATQCFTYDGQVILPV